MICITLVHAETSFPNWKSDHVVRRLWWRTSSRETRSLPLHKLLQSIVLDPAAAAQILSWGAGGKNSGIVGLWDCGIVAKSRFLKFPDFSCFSLFQKWPKIHFSKVPPLWFCAGNPDFGSGGRRSDSRLGRRGEKLGDCGIVGLWDCGEIAISEISGFFMFFLI